MKILFLIFLSILFTNCSKPKTVLICGDHVCVNKAEAEKYFQENLTLEVKILNKDIDYKADLVELNLNRDLAGKKNVSILPKEKTSKKLKTLSNEEVNKIKKNLKKKKKTGKVEKNIISNQEKIQKPRKINKKVSKKDNSKVRNKNANKVKYDVVDVCTILKECSIDEISKYLLKEGKKKSFPDITIRQ